MSSPEDVADHDRAVHRLSGAVYLATKIEKSRLWRVGRAGDALSTSEMSFDKHGISRSGLVLVRAGESLSARLTDGRDSLHAFKPATTRRPIQQGKPGFFRKQSYSAR